MRLIARWSCSMRLLRYFDCRISMSAPLSAHMSRIAAVLAPLLSIVIFSGTPCRPMARLKKHLAAARSRCVRSRKSIVWPAEPVLNFVFEA